MDLHAVKLSGNDLAQLDIFGHDKNAELDVREGLSNYKELVNWPVYYADSGHLVTHYIEGVHAMGVREFDPGKGVCGKTSNMLGKLLKCAHASAYAMFRSNMYAKLLVSHANLNKTDTTPAEYVIPIAKLKQFYRDNSSVRTGMFQVEYAKVHQLTANIVQKLMEGGSWLDLSSAYSRLYLDRKYKHLNTATLLKCYTPRNGLTNRQIDESKNISHNIIIIDALIICCNDVKIHCVLVSQFGERGEQLSILPYRRENIFLYNAYVSN